jgi:hypothetical protein
MDWPQWVIVVLWSCTLGVSIAKHGEEDTKVSVHNAWSTATSIMIIWALLYAGGFF